MSIVNEIYDWIQEGNEGYKTNPDNFGPSSIGGCGRQLAYKKLGVETPTKIEASSLLKMDGGTIYHDSYLNRWKEAGIIHTVEKAGEKEAFGLQWKYFVDGIGTDEKGEFILEYKTIYGLGFRMVEKAPKLDHVYQSLNYTFLEDIPRAKILYHGRDNGYLLSYEITRDDKAVYLDGVKTDYLEQFMAEIEKLKVVRKYIDAGTLPDAPYKINGKKKPDGSMSNDFVKDGVKIKDPWQCSYCAYKTACKGAEIQAFMDSSSQFMINGEYK